MFIFVIYLSLATAGVVVKLVALRFLIAADIVGVDNVLQLIFYIQFVFREVAGR
jgi:hypothetical protein